MSIIHLTDEQLQLYLQGGRSQETSLIEEHLYSCEDCRLQLAVYRSVFTELNVEPADVFSPGFESGIIENLRDNVNKKIQIKNFLLHAAAILFGAIISIYVFLSIQISENIERIFIDDWIGLKYIYDYIFSISSELNISTEVFISVGIILFFYSIFDRLLLFFQNKKFSIFNGVKIFV
jgi:predicted anti-sigma-YlaC factor YlaD